MPNATQPYFWFSFAGAVGFALMFGLALPILFLRVKAHISWMRPGRVFASVLLAQLVLLGIGWGFDAYCTGMGLFSYQPVILFCAFVFLASLTGMGFWKWRKLQRVVSHKELEHEQRIQRAMLEVTRNGYFTSHPSLQDPSQWVVESANRAACQALGYEFKTNFDNELVGLKGEDIVAKGGLARAQQFARQQGKAEYLIQLRCKPRRNEVGDWVEKEQWVEMSGMTIDEPGEIPIRISSFTVVTEFIAYIQEQGDKLKLKRSLEEFEKQVERITQYSMN